MEGYAVVWAARQFDVPVRLIKQVSDKADGQAAFDWPTSVAASARVLGEWLVKNAR
jgi:adenosylhomocysteine nucleosidase